jgi:hypothetical protein
MGLTYRFDLGRSDRTVALRHVFAWLDRSVAIPEAGTVHALLLEHERMDRKTARRAIRGALAWLSHHGTRSEADGVLRWLFDRDGELTGKEAVIVLHTMMRWLGIHGDSTSTRVSFVWIFIELSGSSRSRSYMRTLLQVALKQFPRTVPARVLESVPELPALLALASRAGGARLKQEVEALTVAALWARRMDPSAVSALAIGCYRLVDAGAWHDAAEAEHYLVALGIERSQHIPEEFGV